MEAELLMIMTGLSFFYNTIRLRSKVIISHAAQLLVPRGVFSLLANDRVTGFYFGSAQKQAKRTTTSF